MPSYGAKVGLGILCFAFLILWVELIECVNFFIGLGVMLRGSPLSFDLHEFLCRGQGQIKEAEEEIEASRHVQR